MARHPSTVDAPPDTGADHRGRTAAVPEQIPARGWLDVLRRVKAEVADDHVSLAAAGLAFYGFLAAIPALAAVVTIYGMVTDPAEVQRRVESLFGALPAEAKQLLTDQLSAIVGQSGGALTTGLVLSVVLSLWTASNGVGHLVDAIDLAYDEHDHRNWLVRKAHALALTVGAVLFVVAAGAAIGTAGWLAGRLDAVAPLAWLVRLAWVPLVVVAFGLALAVLYRVGPDRRPARWRWVSWGSAVAVAVWIVASAGFQVYVTRFGSYNETYGSLAAVVILLFWLYLSAFVILLGAELNAELEHQTARDTTSGPERPLGQRDALVADTVAGQPDEPDGASPQER